jgi:protoporphyrinogen oxidase
MNFTENLILGAGVTGISTAGFLGRNADYRIIEKTDSVGGYCKTIKQDGFTWDYSGHFFHFRDETVRERVIKNIDERQLLHVEKKSGIIYKKEIISFPFQRNIHELPKDEFIECLIDFYYRKESNQYSNFLDWLYGNLGQSIVDKFVKPYNEKLYATSLNKLDIGAMGRFFPTVTMSDIMDSMRGEVARTYNSKFLYPRDGAISYVNSLLTYVDVEKIHLNTEVLEVDTQNKIVHTNSGSIRYHRIISSIPLNALLKKCKVLHDHRIFTSNKVLVFNLGFDLPSTIDFHWLYVPSPDIIFYRVGFYNNILREPRMSLYVEIGFDCDAEISIESALSKVMSDLTQLGIVTNQKLISSNHIVMDPAYVHISEESIQKSSVYRQQLAEMDVYSLGRYGEWTYCSIEDNILSAASFIMKLSAN